jgi:hypothetical protein
MNRRLFPFAELMAFAGILAGGYMIVAASRATAIPVAASDSHDARPAPPPAPTLALATTIASARPPVPLRVDRHASYWVGDPQPPATSTDAAVTEPTDKKAPADATARAMIEADGYKNVRSLVQAPGGVWRGLAMRGSVEIAISVAANGSVLAE